MNPTEFTMCDEEGGVFEQIAFRNPHDAFDMNPNLFWKFFHSRYPNVPREDLKTMLEMTRAET